MDAAVARGARVHPWTAVLALADRADGRIVVETSRGAVNARRVVLATNAWAPLLLDVLGDRIRPVRGQVLATEPAPPAFKRAMSANEGYEYWSQRSDGTIVLGGARWAVPDRDEGYYAEELNPTIRGALEQFLRESFPALAGVPVARRWNGIMGFSRDGYPFIGPVPGRPRLLVAAGYTGHGGPYFALAGRCLAELLADGCSAVPVEHYRLDRPLP
jgi:gamma-glutamylputrescine oxidase